MSMWRGLMLLVGAGLLALWITSIAHNQPAVCSQEQTIRQQLTAVAGPTGTVTPTTTPRPTVTPTAGTK